MKPYRPTVEPIGDRRAGYAIIWTLVEVLLICLALYFVISFISALQTINGNAADESTKPIAPILRLGRSTTDCHELWAQFGFSQVVSFDLATLKTRPIYRTTGPMILSFQASLDGQTCMASMDDVDILIFRGQELLVSEPAPNGLSAQLSLCASGKTAVIVFGGTIVRCWDLSDSNPTSSNYTLPETAEQIVLEPDGNKLIVATNSGSIELYEAKTGTRLQGLAKVECLKGCPVFSDDGKWLAVAAGESLKMFDMRSHELAWEVPTGPYDTLQNVIAMSSCNRLVALAGCRSGIQVLDLATGKTVLTFTPDYIVNRMVFSASGDQLYVSASNFNSIRVWSLTTGNELKPIELL